MKNNERRIVIIIILITIISTLLVEHLIFKDGRIENKKQIIKEMRETENESTIKELNKSHEDFALQVQKNKQKLATAITNQKVETLENSSIEEMVINIGKILENSTSDATATSKDILEGKTAYVNGNLLIGEREITNDCNYEIILRINHSVFSYNTPGNVKTISEDVKITIIDGVVTCPTSFYYDTNRKSGVENVQGWVTPKINSISVVSITKL